MAIGTLFGSNPESSGLYGIATGTGNNPTVISQTYFEWFIFTTSAGAPATPTGGSWDFNTNTGTAPVGWTNAVTGVPLNSLWFSIAFVDSRNPTVIVWSTPGLISSQSVYATAYADVFTGNGSTVAWTLSNDPVVVNNTDVSINGVTQRPTTDYTLSGTTLTTTTAAPLNAIILVKYRQALPLSYYGAASNVQFTPVGALTATNVQAAIAEVVTDLALSSGSSTVGFLQAGTGAVATTVQAKLRQTVSVKDFGATGDGTTNDYTAILAAWTYCLANAKNLYFPAGTYNVGANNFPFRTPDTVSPITVLLDCKNITIFGDGPATILKTVSVSGADVLQLNAVQNLTIRDLQVTATISGSVSGSNGVSITNGFDNLNILDVYCYRLPSLDKGSGIIDGGGALSIQTPSTSQVTACGSLIARIRANGCYYGFLANGKFDVLQTIGNRQGVVVDLLAENCCIGYFAGYTVDATYPVIGSTSGITVRATTINCQVDVFAPIQAVGDDITVSVVTSKSKAARLLDPNGVRWDASTVTINDTLYSPGQLCVAGIIERAHNCTIQITGDKGACDYKAAIGASPTSTNSATQYSFIYLDIGGTASIANVVELTSTGGCLTYSTINVTYSTATTANLRTDAPSFFLASRYNQIISGSQTYATSGTWTPVLLDSPAGPEKGATYSAQQGNYVITGGWLHFNLYLGVSGLGTLIGGNNAFIGGLPFANDPLDFASATVGYSTGMALAANNIPTARVGSSDQAIAVLAFRAGANVTGVTITEFSATGQIAISGSYKITL